MCIYYLIVLPQYHPAKIYMMAWLPFFLGDSILIAFLAVL